jgi:hypothetical protein
LAEQYFRHVHEDPILVAISRCAGDEREVNAARRQAALPRDSDGIGENRKAAGKK